MARKFLALPIGVLLVSMLSFLAVKEAKAEIKKGQQMAEQPIKVKLKGLIASTSGDLLTVDIPGRGTALVLIDSTTSIEGDLGLGAFVRIKGELNPDSTIKGEKVKVFAAKNRGGAAGDGDDDGDDDKDGDRDKGKGDKDKGGGGGGKDGDDDDSDELEFESDLVEDADVGDFAFSQGDVEIEGEDGGEVEFEISGVRNPVTNQLVDGVAGRLVITGTVKRGTTTFALGTIGTNNIFNFILIGGAAEVDSSLNLQAGDVLEIESVEVQAPLSPTPSTFAVPGVLIN